MPLPTIECWATFWICATPDRPALSADASTVTLTVLAMAESRWHPPILVAPASPRTFDHDDFSALVWELFERTDFQTHEIQVQVGYFYGDAWPPGWTWINVVLDEASRTAIDAVAAAVVAWGTNWIRKRWKS